MFFIKPSTLVLDCFTPDSNAATLTPIAKAGSYVPDWWRQLPKNSIDKATLKDKMSMRHCAGFVDLYAKSLVLPMWSDFRVAVAPEGVNEFKFEYANGYSEAHVHVQSHRGTYLHEKNYLQMKLLSPWALYTKEEVYWSMFQASYNVDDPSETSILPGMMEFKNLHNLNVQLAIKRKKFESDIVTIPCGQPLIHMVPMTDKKVDVRIHQVSFEEFTHKRVTPPFFSLGYKKAAALRERVTKCPFSNLLQS